MKEKVDFPCKKLEYCPYGCLVEYFPLNTLDHLSWNGEQISWIKRDKTKTYRPCPHFGHDCPVDYVGEKI